MWYIYTTEYYSVIKNNEFMKFLGKWLELENIVLNEVTQSQKNTRSIYSVKWILTPKLRILKIQFSDHMKLKNKEDQSVDTLVFHKRGIKLLMAHIQPMDWA